MLYTAIATVQRGDTCMHISFIKYMYELINN